MRLRSLERELAPALEVDTEVQALDGERRDPDQDHSARDGEPVLRPPDEVDTLPRGDLLRARAHERRVVEPAEAGEDAKKGARHGNGRHHRDQRSDDEHESEALHAAGGDREENERCDDRDDVRVDDRVEALAVTVRDGGAHRFAGSHLFLDALEDDDVRVCRNSDREDQAGEARERERHAEDQERAVEEHAVDPKPDDRDDAEEAVEEEQEERDRKKAADAGDERLVERVLAEGRRDVLPLHLNELDGERAGLEDEREVLCLLHGVQPGDLRPPARDPVAQSRVGDVNPRK